MHFQILHIEDCPNWEEAGRRLRLALDDSGHEDAAVEFRSLHTPAEAAAVEFAGSPTFTVDGADIFPADRIADLACRVYRTPNGLAGLPTVEQLTGALRA